MKIKLFFLSFSIILIIQDYLNAQSIIRVPSDYPTIQEGLDKATDSTVILVSPGIYYENLTWPYNKRAIQLIGIEGSGKTIIDGNLKGRVLLMDGSNPGGEEPYITKSTILKGFTIRNGKLGFHFGAGLYTNNASPTLEDLHFTRNTCYGSNAMGAGASLHKFSGALTNCRFSDNVISNTSFGYGGGLFMMYNNSISLTNCIFENNQVSGSGVNGGGACIRIVPGYKGSDSITLSLNGCRFVRNTLSGEHLAEGGGLIIIGLDPHPIELKMDSCIFSGNRLISEKNTKGAGLSIGGLETIIKNSIMQENTAKQGAGLYFSLSSTNRIELENTIFKYNKVPSEPDNGGSGMYFDNFSGHGKISLTNVVMHNNNANPIEFYESDFEVNMLHCTFYKNENTSFLVRRNFRNNTNIKAVNSVFWNNVINEFQQHFNTVQLDHCIVKGGYQGVGIINQEPTFLSDSLLVPDRFSPCINQGKRLAFPEKDIQGFPRIMPSYSKPDIGAYETDQYFAHARVRFFYDHDKNGIKDQHDKYLLIGKVIDHKGQMHVNHSDSGLYIILEQGTAMIRYAEDVNDKWSPTSHATFIFNVDSDNFTKVIDIGLHPTKINTNVSTLVTSEHFRCGEEILFTLQVINDGTSIENGSFWLSVDDRINFISFVKNPDVVISSHRFAWSFNDLYPGESITIDFYVNAPEVSKPEDVGQIYYFCHGLQDNSPGNESCYEVALRCAYDPNDKIAMPHHSENLVLLGRPMYYTIRFQNTGNDFARHVVIRDTIDQSLDINSIKILHTSHPNNLNVMYNNDREVVFNFRDIILPDSLSDFKGSIGHITYSIQHLPDIPQNTVVKNKANIHFDFNPPINTNTTKNIYTTVFPNKTIDKSEYWIHVFPNPFNDYLLFSLLADKASLLNVDGKLVGEVFNTDRISVNLPSGLYFLILHVDGKKSTHKVILSDP